MDPLAALPAELQGWRLVLEAGGTQLRYTFATGAEAQGMPALLAALSRLGIAFTDLQTRQSRLEDIFVDLVAQSEAGAAA